MSRGYWVGRSFYYGYKCDGCGRKSYQLKDGWNQTRWPTPDAPGFSDAPVDLCPNCDEPDPEFIEEISTIGTIK